MEKVGFKKELRVTCTKARAGPVNNAADETRNDELQDLYAQSDDDGFMRITVQNGRTCTWWRVIGQFYPSKVVWNAVFVNSIAVFNLLITCEDHNFLMVGKSFMSVACLFSICSITRHWVWPP